MKPDGGQKRVKRSAEHGRGERKLKGGEQSREARGRQSSACEACEHECPKRCDGERAETARGLDEERIARCVGAAGPQVDPVAHGAQEEDLIPLPGIRSERERTGRDEEGPRGCREGERGNVRAALQAGRV